MVFCPYLASVEKIVTCIIFRNLSVSSLPTVILNRFTRTRKSRNFRVLEFVTFLHAKNFKNLDSPYPNPAKSPAGSQLNGPIPSPSPSQVNKKIIYTMTFLSQFGCRGFYLFCFLGWSAFNCAICA